MSKKRALKRKKASNILQPESHSAQADFTNPEAHSPSPLERGPGGEAHTPADIADRLQPESHSAQADFTNPEAHSPSPLERGPGGEAHTPADIADRYTFTRFLGRGTQGSVYAAERKSDSLPVAIKVLQINSIQNWKEYELFWREESVKKSV